MAITNCPECGKEISSSAKACPNCGYSFQKDKTLLIGAKSLFGIVNLVYLWRRLNLKNIITYSALDMFRDYFDNREIDNYDNFDFISSLQLATTSSDEKYIIIIALMIIAFIFSTAFIIKNKFNIGIVFFSTIPILSELFFIFADGTYIEGAVHISTLPFAFVTLKYIFLGIAISIIEFIIYKKIIQPTTIPTNTVEQTNAEANEEVCEQASENITEQDV